MFPQCFQPLWRLTGVEFLFAAKLAQIGEIPACIAGN
jgi:hypothetical protein